MKQKKYLTFFLSITCIILLIFLFKLGIFESLELKTLDFRFRLFAEPETANKDVVIVAIDEKSLRVFKENNIVWKWPRNFYAKLVEYLNRGQAKTIVFDILFPDSDIDRLSSDAEETDGAFAQAVKDAGNVIFASHLIPNEDLLTEDNPLVWEKKYEFINDIENLDLDFFPSAIHPLELFQNQAASLGAANYHEDKDGICRRLPLFLKYQDHIFLHLGLATYLQMNQIEKIEINQNNTIGLGELKVPIDNNARYLVNWYGKGGPDGSFDYYSIGALISSALAEDNGRQPTLPSSHFKDKIVIIGSNAAALMDFKNTPFTIYEPYPGMEIYATMISNFMQNDFLSRVHSFVPIAIIILFVMIVFYTFLYTHKIRYILLVSISCIVGWIIITFWLFHAKNLWLDFVTPEIAIVLAFAASALFNYQTEGKARRYLRSTFGKYLSPLVISEIIEKNDQVELGGKELKTTIYFSDIKDFTTISEQIPPKDLVILLNEYFSLNTDIILRYQGLLDKYIGDAVMAVFGAPIEIEDHASLACTAALEVQNVMNKIRQSDQNQKPITITRIGINTGTVIVGNIGSNLRLDYTAIGDSVNLASRLEGVNKVFSTNIIISETTYEEVKERYVTRQLDRMRVKGKLKPISIYELISKNDEIDQSQLNTINSFQEGIHLYNEKKFIDAKKIFQNFLSINSNDGPSQVYIRRCEQFLESPPPQDWDGVFKMETK